MPRNRQMLIEHPLFTIPPADTKIWRYMDLTKLVDLLNTAKLFFARADKLGDDYEGHYPDEDIRRKRRSLAVDMNNLQFMGIKPGVVVRMGVEMARQRAAISCWHANDGESAAMWRLYLKSDEGVAIQSNVGRLVELAEQEKEHTLFVGSVNYIDFTKERLPDGLESVGRFLYKRKSFEHEKELRAIVYPENVEKFYGMSPLTNGVSIPIPSLDRFVEKVYVAPTAPEWIVESIRAVVERFGLAGNKVVSSDLNKAPIY